MNNLPFIISFSVLLTCIFSHEIIKATRYESFDYSCKGPENSEISVIKDCVRVGEHFHLRRHERTYDYEKYECKKGIWQTEGIYKICNDSLCRDEYCKILRGDCITMYSRELNELYYIHIKCGMEWGYLILLVVGIFGTCFSLLTVATGFVIVFCCFPKQSKSLMSRTKGWILKSRREDEKVRLDEDDDSLSDDELFSEDDDDQILDEDEDSSSMLTSDNILNSTSSGDFDDDDDSFLSSTSLSEGTESSSNSIEDF